MKSDIAIFDIFGCALQSVYGAVHIVKTRDEVGTNHPHFAFNDRQFQAESWVIHAIREAVVELTEPAFKPLFRRPHNWAFL
jgi:hypothetical protein